MRVRFTREAFQRLEGIRRFLALDSAQMADDVLQSIVSHAESLSTLPRRGRVVPEYQRDDIRELLVYPPYRIIYRVGLDEVTVLSVMHGHQLLPDDLGPE